MEAFAKRRTGLFLTATSRSHPRCFMGGSAFEGWPRQAIRRAGELAGRQVGLCRFARPIRRRGE
jgi:hypothetical protein